MSEIRACGSRFPDLISAAQCMREQPGVCPSCGHRRHDGLAAPCGVYPEGRPGCRCVASVVLVAQTVYSLGPVN